MAIQSPEVARCRVCWFPLTPRAQAKRKTSKQLLMRTKKSVSASLNRNTAIEKAQVASKKPGTRLLQALSIVMRLLFSLSGVDEVQNLNSRRSGARPTFGQSNP